MDSMKPGDLIQLYCKSIYNYDNGLYIFKSLEGAIRSNAKVPQIPPDPGFGGLRWSGITVKNKPMLILEIQNKHKVFYLKILSSDGISGWTMTTNPQDSLYGFKKCKI